MNPIELLAPAGNLERLKMAITYGADAVYAGGEAFSLRAAAKNFSHDELAEGIEFAHQRGKKIYITANIIPHNEDIDAFPKFLEEMNELGPDGLIISDLGAFTLAKELVPDIPLHVSTQANNVNYQTVSAWHTLGAKRVVLARELSLSEIAQIRKNVPSDLELEAFVHGAMCISYSGRCLLSNYMASRDANQGECAHPCRWNYSLVEQKRPGEYMDVFENERGTFIFNSRDLCMIEHIPELIESGITSFKLEGRVKTEYYVASVVKTYREAIDSYLENPEKYIFQEKWNEELKKVSNRHYTTGFYLGKPDSEAQVYGSSAYIRTYEVVGMVVGYDEETGETLIEQRNRFFTGDTLEIVPPVEDFVTYTVDKMKNEDGEEIDSCPHAQQIIRLKLPKHYPIRTMLRKVRESN
ncbi:MAG: U32 family peptidase [Clostridia bacterium]|nr:U32 family peptidase [Clostridia bacterium]MBQ3553358.1 U32 family peptidase [Clostridia bacterium]